MKPVPALWWDFAGNTDAVIVQSDVHDKPIMSYPVPLFGDAIAQIAQAESLIADLNSGRKSFKELGL
jgi:hypothetical protein